MSIRTCALMILALLVAGAPVAADLDKEDKK